MTGPQRIYWILTFATETEGFLGAAVVEASTMIGAVQAAKDHALVPAGAMSLGLPVRLQPDHPGGFEPGQLNRVLTFEELRTLPNPGHVVEVLDVHRRAGAFVKIHDRASGAVLSGFTEPHDKQAAAARVNASLHDAKAFLQRRAAGQRQLALGIIDQAGGHTGKSRHVVMDAEFDESAIAAIDAFIEFRIKERQP